MSDRASRKKIKARAFVEAGAGTEAPEAFFFSSSPDENASASAAYNSSASFDSDRHVSSVSTPTSFQTKYASEPQTPMNGATPEHLTSARRRHVARSSA